MLTIAVIKALVKDITALSKALPLSVKQGTKDDKIWSVMNADERDTEYETFNRRFDAMFGEDCRDSAGRLQHIRQGKLGLGLVCAYLSKRDWGNGFPLDLVEIKLQRLIAELEYLRYVTVVIHLFIPCNWLAYSGSEAARPSRHIALTSKLIDANNTEKPQLSFQRNAVHAFHSTHHAQKTASSTTAPAPSQISSTIIDADNEYIDSDGCEDIYVQSISCMFMYWEPDSLDPNSCYSQTTKPRARNLKHFEEKAYKCRQ